MLSGNAFYSVPQGAAYLFPVYAVFAVWNLPTWLLERATGMALFNTIPSMIWMKLMLVPFLVLSTVQIFRIIDKSKNREYAQLGAFLFFSSILVIYPIGIIGQYDILGIPLILWGISNWMDNKPKSFLLAFSFALVFKYFALFYFLPLLLLKEKRIFRIVRSCLFILLPSLLFSALFPRPNGGIGNSGLISLLLKGPQISDGKAVIYWFPLVFALVLIAAYFHEPGENGDELKIAADCLFVTMASFCVLVDPYPYWVILAAPAFVLMLATRSCNANKLLVLESALSWVITIKNYILYYWCFGVKTTGGMGVLHRLLGMPSPDPSEKYSVLLRYYNNLEMRSFVFTALFGICLATVFFSCSKCRHIKLWEPLNNGVLYLRTLGNLALAFLPAAYIVFHMLFR
ncbi:MAG: hypothetical protein K6F56_08545 [Oscillospiraceae bacterium]|nr:hypothetical protein [Oscillospiraceae bacterium]